MRNPYQNENDDLDDLLRQVDDLLVSEEDQDQYYDNSYNEQYGASSEEAFESDDYDDLDDDDEPMLYQNYSNNYGADVQNFANGYGGRQVQQPEPAAPAPSIPAYNADFRQQSRRDSAPSNRGPRQNSMSQKAVRRQQKAYYEDYEDDPIPPQYAPKPKKAKKAPKRRRRGCGCSTGLFTLIILVVGIFGLFHLLVHPPKADSSIGSHKRDTASILLCGVDEGGTRTDTMMLMYLSGSEHKVGLLSIPRDTYFVTSGGYDAKLNSAYGLNNCGEEGMEGLFDHIEDLIGYRPDGYLLVDFNLVPKIGDLMGGLDINLPTTIDEAGVYLEEGLQHLNGSELLTVLRHRSSYYNADLGRVEVQREVMKACMDQWVSFRNLGKAFSALHLVDNNSLTSLSVPNYLWMAKTILLNLNNFSTDTLPGYPTMIDGVSYYMLNPDEVAQMINESYNPYRAEISVDSLNIDG